MTHTVATPSKSLKRTPQQNVPAGKEPIDNSQRQRKDKKNGNRSFEFSPPDCAIFT